MIQIKSVSGRKVAGLFRKDGSMVFEVKSGAYATPEVQAATRTVTGVFAVYGNVDATRDRMDPGSLTKTMQERGPAGAGKIRYLWNHDQSQPPVAVITGMQELQRAELPAQVLLSAPDAQGGASVTRQYLDTPLADAVYKNIQSNGLNELSYGFLAMKYSFEKDSADQPNYLATRAVQEAKLMETSDVHWGANEATVSALKADPMENWGWFMDNLKHIPVSGEHREAFRDLYLALKRAFESGDEPPSGDPPAEPGPIDQSPTQKAAAERSVAVARARLRLMELEA